jgi:hypothetical protein
MVDNPVRNVRNFRVTFVLIIAVAVVASAQTGVEAKRFEAIRNYWEWSSYLGVNGLDFPFASFRSGSSFSALVFFDDYPVGPRGQGYSSAYWGFCSSEIALCHAYAADADGAVSYAYGTRIGRRETEELALARFRAQGFEESATPPPARSGPPPSSTGGVGRPAIDPLIVGAVPGDPYTIRTLRRRITLPTIGIPSAVKRKVSNLKAESEVKKALYQPNSRSGCTIVVPFADERVARLPVLVDCPKGSSVTIVSKRGEEWSFTHGGLIENRSIIDRLAPRIRASASLTLQE